jgi:hypothetical protein
MLIAACNCLRVRGPAAAKTLQTAGLADMPALAAAANADQRQGSGNSGSSSGSAPPQGAGAAKAPAPAPGSSGSSSSSNTAGSPPQPQPQPQPQRPRAPMPPGESSVPQQVRALGNPSCVWLPEAQQCTPTQDNWLIPAEGLPSSPFRRCVCAGAARRAVRWCLTNAQARGQRARHALLLELACADTCCVRVPPGNAPQGQPPGHRPSAALHANAHAGGPLLAGRRTPLLLVHGPGRA